MSEEEKINKPPDDNTQSPQNNPVNSEPEVGNEQQTSDINKSETKNMEVHKHPHHLTHKKKWTEYLLEFFMLFFAVFLGFVGRHNFF